MKKFLQKYMPEIVIVVIVLIVMHVLFALSAQWIVYGYMVFKNKFHQAVGGVDVSGALVVAFTFLFIIAAYAKYRRRR